MSDIPILPTADAERFWSFVSPDRGDGCREWMGRRRRDGYGWFKPAGGSVTLAHRVAVALDGRNPDSLVVRHACDNPPCVNPAHLLLGTHQDNVNDKMARGRYPKQPTKLPRYVIEYCRVSNAIGVKQKTLRLRFGVSVATMSLYIRGLRG